MRVAGIVLGLLALYWIVRLPLPDRAWGDSEGRVRPGPGE